MYTYLSIAFYSIRSILSGNAHPRPSVHRNHVTFHTFEDKENCPTNVARSRNPKGGPRRVGHVWVELPSPKAFGRKKQSILRLKYFLDGISWE